MSEPRLTTARRRLEADCRTALEAAQGREEIIAVVRRLGLERLADRLDELIELEAEEPDEAPMDIDSLRAATDFLLRDPRMPRPGIGVGYDGVVGFDWRLQPEGIVWLEFPPVGQVQYAIVAPSPAGPDEHVSLSGASERAALLEVIKPYLARGTR